MPRLTILRGISGSGKSTWAREQNAVVVSRDTIRVALFGEFTMKDEALVTLAQDSLIAAALKAGKDVVVDNTNIEWKYVKALAKIGYTHGADVEIKVFDVPLQRALNNVVWRAANGGLSVPPEVIRKQHDRFQGNKNKVLDPAFVPAPYSGTPGKPKAFLFDLDGTVYHMGDKRGPYDHNVDVDDPDPTIIHIVRTMALELIPIAMSGRKTATRGMTIDCLIRDDIPFDYLFMRADGDDRPDNIIKAELFDKHVRRNFDVQFVLDDRNQVVDMWRRMGLTCLQVAEGEF